MKLTLSLAIALFVVVVLAEEIYRGKPHLDNEWKKFKNRHKRKYANAKVEGMRRQRFEETIDSISKHNDQFLLGKQSYKQGLNHLADMSPEERSALKADIDSDPPVRAFDVMPKDFMRKTVQSSVDLRNDSCMPAVKNQGMCGSCYTFAANTPVEYQQCKKTGKPVVLSEQNLIDCTASYGNMGCQGGLALNCWKYMMGNGVDSSDSYPYTGSKGICTFKSADVQATVQNWYYATTTWNETELQAAVSNYGPVAVSIDASGWDFYESGVFSSPSCSKTASNHAVVVVGYGRNETSNQDYWIIRNSWSDAWGLNGYILLERGVGMCSIAKRAVYPIV